MAENTKAAEETNHQKMKPDEESKILDARDLVAQALREVTNQVRPPLP